MPSSELNAFEIFKEKHIPNSLFIDLEEISDPNSNLPHMMPSEELFSKKISSLVIKNSDYLLKISINEQIESLNISNSVAVVLHHINNLRKE